MRKQLYLIIMLKLQPKHNNKVEEKVSDNILNITDIDTLIKENEILKYCNTYDKFQSLQGFILLIGTFFSINYTMGFADSFKIKILIAMLTFLPLAILIYVIIDKISHIFLKKFNSFNVHKSYKELDKFLYENNNLNVIINSFTIFFKENPQAKGQKKFKYFLLNVATKEKVDVIPTFSDFILNFYKNRSTI